MTRDIRQFLKPVTGVHFRLNSEPHFVFAKESGCFPSPKPCPRLDILLLLDKRHIDINKVILKPRRQPLEWIRKFLHLSPYSSTPSISCKRSLVPFYPDFSACEQLLHIEI